MHDQKTFYEHEREKWDRISGQKLDAAAKEQLILKPGDDFYTYCQRDSVMFGVREFLGDLAGKSVLEVGCGSGKIAARVAKTGAHVTAFDLSPVSVEVAATRASLNALLDRIHLTVAAGERFPFASHSFDIVLGRAILHHLDASQGSHEIHRVLKPGGKALFVEPLGMNPVLNFVRDHVPYPGKNPVGDDQPLNYRQIRSWGAPFRRFEYHEVHLLGMIERAFGHQRVHLAPLHRLDRTILKVLPVMGRFCRYAVITMEM